ncbi:hypothetical protein IAQ61_006875 [Plenodomus lingam]|uniref:uncharacterized protein n=1 Tax=Leptosphaeria maculans TaxID=5022 RepID=UPI003322699B|nr:hypothetical protein IAQ61_006875 [Plenodomus lingam]
MPWQGAHAIVCRGRRYFCAKNNEERVAEREKGGKSPKTMDEQSMHEAKLDRCSSNMNRS